MVVMTRHGNNNHQKNERQRQQFRKQVSISLSLFSQTQHIVNLSLSGHTWCVCRHFFLWQHRRKGEKKKPTKCEINFQWSLIEPTHEEACYRPKLIMVRSKLTRHESAAHLPSLSFTSTSPNPPRKCARKAKNSRKDCRCEIFHVFLFFSLPLSTSTLTIHLDLIVAESPRVNRSRITKLSFARECITFDRQSSFVHSRLELFITRKARVIVISLELKWLDILSCRFSWSD